MELDETGVNVENASARPASSSTDESRSPMQSSTDAAPSSEVSNAQIMGHDSLVTVRLSSPTSLHIDTRRTITNDSILRNSSPEAEDNMSISTFETAGEEEDNDPNTEEEEESETEERSPTTPFSSDGRSLEDELQSTDHTSDDNMDDSDDDCIVIDTPVAGSRRSSSGASLPNTRLQDEEQMDQEGNSTIVLLAKLEQENARLGINSRASEGQDTGVQTSIEQQPQRLAGSAMQPALRYSKLPPPPMTDLEFYAAVVKDYQQTVARLPTLFSNKIRKGIPPPLRGVVWQSMSGARDAALEDVFDNLTGQTSPYEGIIGKDLGRCFPGVDLFRDPDGDGQRMLGRVLQCFSLYDEKIGYCQGLTFLVGPLLMHMPDRQAFCVLVRLMDQYDLRSCFLPDLSGLHVRIYQFRELLRQNLPALSTRLEDLQVDPVYVSQWFLSFFAVTCPLPMLFRIYDVIFAEGASETLMRVALSLMRRNQARILSCTELEDVMQLLLSRGLWDCYHYNADELVYDFVSFSGVVTKESLAALERQYRDGKRPVIGSGASAKSADAAQSAEVSTAASRFLGRLWTNSSTPKLASFSDEVHSPSTITTRTLSPGLSAPSRPLSMLRRSTSKQSLASTLNSMDAGFSSTSSSAASVLSSASTDLTSVSRDSASANDSSLASGPAVGGGPGSKAGISSSSNGNSGKEDNRYLHSQIEDLLTALSGLQREQASLADQLQKEREERDDDKKAVRLLLDGLRQRASADSASAPTGGANGRPTPEQLSSLLDSVEQRFGTTVDNRRSSIPQTKYQLRDDLARAREQLSNELAKSQDFNRRIYDLEQELATAKDNLKDSHTYVRNLHMEKQRLDKQILGLKTRASDIPVSGLETTTEWLSRATGIAIPGNGPPVAGGGLRELKLGRSRSTPVQATPTANNRISSFMMRGASSGRESRAGSPAPANDHDALLQELAQAKTAEAVARQEAEEYKQKLESLRKAFGLALGPETATVPAAGGSIASYNNTSALASAAATQASAAATAAMGMFGRLTERAMANGTTAPANTSTIETTGTNKPLPTPITSLSTGGQAVAAAPGSFWGWRRG